MPDLRSRRHGANQEAPHRQDYQGPSQGINLGGTSNACCQIGVDVGWIVI